MKFIKRWAATLVAVGVMGMASSAWALSLGSAADFAVLTVPGSSYLNFSAVTVNGNVGVGSGGSLNLMSPSTINGDVYLTSAGQMYGPGTLNGTSTVNAPYVAQAISDAMTAYNTATALAPTVTINGNLTTNTSITGNGGMNVIKITGNVNLNSQSLTLNGTSADTFVINVAGGFDLGGNGGIVAGAGVSASQILINVESSGTKLTSKVGNIVDGTLLAPYDPLEFHSVSGAIFAGGGGEVKLMSDATVDNVPFSPPPPPPPPPGTAVPEPLTAGLSLLGLVALGFKAVSRQRA